MFFLQLQQQGGRGGLFISDRYINAALPTETKQTGLHLFCKCAKACT